MFQRIAPPKAGRCHSLHYPLPHQESAPLGYNFVLPAMKGTLPAELKLRENTDEDLSAQVIVKYNFKTPCDLTSDLTTRTRINVITFDCQVY